MAGRILGQGDLMSLIESAQTKLDEDEMRKQQEALEKGQFTLVDFRKMYDQIRKLGSMGKLLGMIPGMGGLKDMLGNEDLDKSMKRYFAMIDSMTPAERISPRTIDQSRRKRIAAGSGTQPNEVNELLKQFDMMAGMMKSMSGKGVGDRMAMMKQMQGMMTNPGAMMAPPKKDTGTRLTAQQRADLKKQREKELRRKNREKRK
jgi:signal recognition particle subunit SRP54